MSSAFRAALLVVAVTGLSASPVLAAARKSPPADPRIAVMEQQLRDIQQQLATLKGGTDTASRDNRAALDDMMRSASSQYADLKNRLDAQPKVRMDGGRLAVASADGAFSLSVRSLIQFDVGYFAQGRNPAGVDLGSGTNFRRAQFAFVGTAWRDWSYNFTYDFGGNGIEKSGYIYSAYIQYDGLKGIKFRMGAYSPPAGIDDSTGNADLVMLERASASDIARNIAGAPSRNAASVILQGDTYLAALSYSGSKVGDTAFDEQQAVVGRAGWLAVNNADMHLLLDANFTHVFKLADIAPGANSPTAASFSNGPELAVDTLKTVNTGNIDASSISEWGLETAGNWGAAYGQGGYFHYSIARRASVLPDPSFSGWYALVAWSLTGEPHRYDASVASFRAPRPDHPLGKGGFGAWELAARYSSINLDYQPLVALASGGIAGGKQDVWSLGLNWYPTDGIRFALNYDNIKVGHINAPVTDITADAVGLRAQISL